MKRELDYLNYAIQLAEMVEGQTGTNPPVGAVIVKNGRIIGIGAHLKKGQKHAEIQAIDMAGAEHVAGSTMYVSLEPCSHYGETPPCAERIIELGISKVIYAARDVTLPSTGHAMMERAGIEVEYRKNVQMERSYQSFFSSKMNALPIVTVKVSASLDGKQATDSSESQWITSKAVKSDVFKLRHTHDAIITGNGTLSKDNPSLTVRKEEGHHPTRVILSKSGQLQWGSKMFHDLKAPIYIYTENTQLTTDLENVCIVKLKDCRIDYILKDLYERGFGRVLVEAGPNITSQFLASPFVTHFILYLAPKIIGGQGLYQFYQTAWVQELDQIPQFEIVHSEMLDTDLKLHLKRK